jgi:cyclopropane fatty-acyl-phospholipid synthase-like methyltransferase
VTVWAVDPSIRPDDVRKEAEREGVAERVVPLRADVRRMPIPHRWFDAVVSVNAYHYFGTDGALLWELARYLRPGGRMAVSMIGTTTELDEAPEWWSANMQATLPVLHSPAWWARLWSITSELTDVQADALGTERWKQWCDLLVEHRVGSVGIWEAERAMLVADADRTLTIVRAIATRVNGP